MTTKGNDHFIFPFPFLGRRWILGKENFKLLICKGFSGFFPFSFISAWVGVSDLQSALACGGRTNREPSPYTI